MGFSSAEAISIETVSIEGTREGKWLFSATRAALPPEGSVKISALVPWPGIMERDEGSNSL